MTVLERFKTGITLASASFTMIRRNKSLVLYMLIPVAANVLFLIATDYQLPFTTLLPILTYIRNKLWFSMIIFSLLDICLSTLRTFSTAALIIHATHLIRTKSSSTVKQSFSATFTHWVPLVQWTLLSSLITLLINSIVLIQAPKILVVCVYLSAQIVWTLASFLVLVFITLEPVSMPRAVALSWITTKNNIPEFFGGNFWIGVVYSLLKIISIGIVILFILIIIGISAPPFYVIGGIPELPPFYLQAIALPIRIYINTAHVIFAALFFDTYFERPIEELALAQYDLEL